jgi:hypothetical protein
MSEIFLFFPHLKHIFSMIHLLRSHNTTEEERSQALRLLLVDTGSS